MEKRGTGGLKVLISAYSCQPGRGSEPGVGWNAAVQMSRHHEVWVLTQGTTRRGDARVVIEEELDRNPVPSLNFVYYDLPRWMTWLRRKQQWTRPYYYYLWQLGAYRVARKLCDNVAFDLAQHVTFVVYWKPTLLALLPIPFIWGPIGGGESAPKTFLDELGFRHKVYESTRDLARWVGEHDPLVRLAARRSRVALATTEETATRLRKLGAADVRVCTESGLDGAEMVRLSQHNTRAASPLRFVSVGRLLHWKGFYLGLRSFARAGLADAEYWIVGDGPERRNLEALVEELGIADRVRFWGALSRDEALRKMGECHALVHPSLHDSGGWVCLEAMASEHPVICLDLGGPGVQVTEETGFKIPAAKPEQAVDEMAAAMRALSEDRGLIARMGEAGRRRVAESFSWNEKAARMIELYGEVRAKA